MIQGLFSIIDIVLGRLIPGLAPWIQWVILVVLVVAVVLCCIQFDLSKVTAVFRKIQEGRPTPDSTAQQPGGARRRWWGVLLLFGTSIIIMIWLILMAKPGISLDYVPPAGEGNPQITYPISGRVCGFESDRYKVVVFARPQNMLWYIQPTVDGALTNIQEGKWHTCTHPGFEYAVLLVKPSFQLPKDHAVPSGPDVLAITVIPGTRGSSALVCK